MNKTTYNENGFYNESGITRWDHNNLSEDPRIRTLQYRAAGYQTLTIAKIIQAVFGDEYSYEQIRNWISNSSFKFQKRTSNKEMESYYKEINIKHLGRQADDSKEFTYNKVLPVFKQRKFIGLTVEEQKLLKRIRK